MTYSQIIQEVFPFWYYVTIDRDLKRKINSRDRLRGEEEYSTLDEERLEKCLEDEHQRASSIEEKTFKQFLSLSFIVAILTSALPLLQKNVIDLDGTIQEILNGIIVICLLYVCFAGFSVLRAIRTQTIYGYGASFLLKRQSKGKQILTGALVRQELTNLRIRNNNEVAFMALRNGFILVFIGILILGATFLWKWLFG